MTMRYQYKNMNRDLYMNFSTDFNPFFIIKISLSVSHNFFENLQMSPRKTQSWEENEMFC